MTYQDNEIEFFASCVAGFEPWLARELEGLRIRRTRPLKGGVAFFGGAADGERVCLWSRLASRVTAVVGRVNAGDAELLYAGVRNLSWEDVLSEGASVAVRAHGTNGELRNTQFTALKVKDALCDRMRERTGARPDVDSHDPDVLVDVRVRERRATVSVDLVGESLHRRTYLDERDGPDAPLLCAQAAGLLAASDAGRRLREGWGVFDPASDAGYLVCEAAMMAADLAPGLLRERWGFFGWALHDDQAWADALDEADARFEAGLGALLAKSASKKASDVPDLQHVRIVGASASSPAIARARGHLRRAGLRAVASVEAMPQDGAKDMLVRLASVVGVPASSGAPDTAVPAIVVASVAPLDRDGSDARAIFETTAFMAAVRMAPAGSVFAMMGERSLRTRFGTEPSASVNVGAGRIEACMEVYENPPAALESICVPDSAGGADHVIEVHDAKAAQFASRLRKVARERRKWVRREGVSCYRVYDADLPEYNVAIDIYEGALDADGITYAHVAEYHPPASVDEAVARMRFDDVLAIVPQVLGVRPDHVFSKVRERSAGGSQYRSAGRRSYVTYTREGDGVFEVDLAGYLDTGLFLDHRPTRLMLAQMAKDADFLNLFAYTGAATVHAALGGARTTTTVDLSQTYLDWAQRNMELNGFPAGSPDEFVRANVTDWIRDARRDRRVFDLIFVDPPTFSNSKAMGRRTWDVQRDHTELLIGVSRLLAPGGVAVFSCNLRTFKPDVETLSRYGVELEDITARTIPHDFERNPRIHHCYLVRRAKR